MKGGTQAVTRWEELQLSRENRQLRRTRYGGWKRSQQHQQIWSLYLGAQTPLSLAAQAAFVTSVSFLRQLGKSQFFTLEQNFPLPSRTNFIAGNFTSIRKMLIGWSCTPVCSIKSNCLCETSSLKEDLITKKRLPLKFLVDHSRNVHLRKDEGNRKTKTY